MQSAVRLRATFFLRGNKLREVSKTLFRRYSLGGDKQHLSPAERYYGMKNRLSRDEKKPLAVSFAMCFEPCMRLMRMATTMAVSWPRLKSIKERGSKKSEIKISGWERNYIIFLFCLSNKARSKEQYPLYGCLFNKINKIWWWRMEDVPLKCPTIREIYVFKNSFR